jgi:hypothetical protein
METKWAEENLQTIRTLMERSAVYRRALAPVMIFAGTVGVAGGIIGSLRELKSQNQFLIHWVVVAAVALAGSILLVRWQALKDSEPFWSPPTRRVIQALLAPFCVGAFAAAMAIYADQGGEIFAFVILWCWLYGCALCAAGFFMPRGMRLFGWVFILAGCSLVLSFLSDPVADRLFGHPDILMGAIFGGLHLAYGIYLYFTERKNPVA